tara:strand:+ start:837 stop:1985 length:1149 start_codon:yes stop_codon:yes gene_type:complete
MISTTFFECVSSTNKGKANHDCVINLIIAVTVIFGLAALPIVKDFKINIVNSFGNNTFDRSIFFLANYAVLLFLSFAMAIRNVNVYSKSFNKILMEKNVMDLYINFDVFLEQLGSCYFSEHDKIKQIFLKFQTKITECMQLDCYDSFFIGIRQELLIYRILVLYKNDPRYAYDEIKAQFNLDKEQVVIKPLNDLFSMCMRFSGNARFFYEFYNLWLLLKLDLPQQSTLDVKDFSTLDRGIEVLVQEYAPNYPEDFINFGLLLGGNISKLRAFNGSCYHSTTDSYLNYIRLGGKHPINTNRRLKETDLETVEINQLLTYIPALIYGFKICHLNQLYKNNVSDPAIEKIIETLGQNDKNKPSCQALIKKFNEVKRPTINFMNAC